jgi:hypothetical protein
MNAKPDILVSSASSEPRLIVEVKNKPDADGPWASRLRRNLLVHYHLPRTTFFMVASPTRFFLWKEPKASPEAPADFEVDASQVLSRYMPSSTTSEAALEVAVRSWISDVVREANSPNPQVSATWLAQSGLMNSLRDAHLSTESHE